MSRLRCCFVVGCAALIALASPAMSEVTQVMVAFNHHFEFKITDDAVDSAPRWNSRDANPPISARAAIEYAAKEVRKVKTLTPPGWTWQLVSVDLRPWGSELLLLSPKDIGKWYWSVTFVAFPGDDPINGSPNEFHVAVLMDGTICAPHEVPPQPIQQK